MSELNYFMAANMSHIIISSVLALSVFVISCCAAQESVGQPKPMQCNVGPLTKTFGSTPWRLYSCSDGKSLVVVTAQGSPAAPFYFMFQATSNGHHLVGEGTGNKSETDKAYLELRQLPEQKILALVDETKLVNKH
jgi:hypothetical protein